MKARCLATLLLLVASSASGQLPYTEKQVIDYAKSIDVKTLDPSLPSQRLEEWLQSVAPHAQSLSWLVEDTCWQKPDHDEDYPLCAHIRIIRNGQLAEFLVEIGTLRKGIVGSPKLSQSTEGISIRPDVVGSTMGYGERLSDLPGLLNHPNLIIIAGVRKLYEEIVVQHPIGIPAGTEKVAIWPLLSKRLAGQLQTAQACQEDYFRQRQTTGGAMKPRWLETGIFSGDGNRAVPTGSFAFNTGQQKDGSFLVYVELRFANDDHLWDVAASVVAEDSRFAVDDVRIFDTVPSDGTAYRLPGPTDGPSHLLSEEFSGCDGPRWTGLLTSNK
jgi:hypothetical protein